MQAEATRASAFGAHPDDLEVGAGGLLSRLASQRRAGDDRRVSRCRRSSKFAHGEAQRGAQILGARLAILNPDKKCRVEDIPMHQLVAQMDMLVNDIRPDLVITHSAHDLHWDHGLVNRATVSALRRMPCNLLAYVSSYEMNAQNSTRSVGQCFADITRDDRPQGRGDRGACVAAAEHGSGIDARSGARDGAVGGCAVRRGVRSVAAAVLSDSIRLRLQGDHADQSDTHPRHSAAVAAAAARRCRRRRSR